MFLPLAIGLVIVAIANPWVTIVVGASFVRFPPRSCVIWVATSFVLSYLLEITISLLPSSIKLGIFLVTPLLALLLSWGNSRDILMRSSDARMQAPADSSVTQPRSYLPLSHSLYVTLFVFSLATGFVRTYGSGTQGPLVSFLAMIPLLVILLVMVFSHGLRIFDLLYLVAALLIMAGFLMVTVSMPGWTYWANTVIEAGGDCFQVLIVTVLAAAAARNRNMALVVIPWGSAARTLGSGLLGPQLGHLVNTLTVQSTGYAQIFILAIAFCFMAYNLIVLHSFSFEGTIEGITPVADPVVAAGPSQIASRFDVIADKYGLTPREKSVAILLASGRNNSYIQDNLCLARNTVKSHIRHIYAKLQIHSQQELIDLVEK